MISLLKQPKCKSEQMSPSVFKKWFATANCQCFLRGLSPVFWTMSPITSTPWEASWMLTTSIHLLQSMHCYSTCSGLYTWLLYHVVFLCINGYFHVFPSVLSVLSISLGNEHTSSVKVVLFSHNSSPHRISRVNCKKNKLTVFHK